MSFRFKTICGIALIEALLLCFLIYGDLDSLRRSSRDQLERRAASVAGLFAASVADDCIAVNVAGLKGQVDSLARDPSVLFVEVRSPRLGVLAMSDVSEAAAAGAESAWTARAGVEVNEGGVSFCQASVVVCDASMAAAFSAARERSLAIGAAGMLLSAVFSWLLGSWLTRQLAGLTGAAEALAEGRLGVRAPESGRDELGRLGAAFNRMAAEQSRYLDDVMEKAANFRSFYETVDACLLVADAAGTILSANPALCDRLGYTAGALVGRGLTSLFEASGRSGLRQRMAALTTGEVACFGVPMCTAAGEAVAMETRVVRGVWDGRPAYFAIGKDVSALRRSEERLRQIADYTYDWEYWLAPDGAYAWVSPACRRITGYAPEAFLADANFLLSIVHPDDRQRLAEHMRFASDASLNPCSVDFRIIHANGAVVWIEHCCRAIFGPDVEFLGRRGVNRDVTERKQAEEAIQAARDAAEAANQAKSQFLATMSHEVRTPLNGVMGMLQMQSAMDLPSEQAEIVAVALESARKLLAILNDILDIARIEAGKVVLCHEEADIARLLPSVAGIFAADVRAKGLALDVAVDPAMPPLVVTDEGRLRQILFNLVGNAVKFTSSGRVSLWAGVLPVCPDPHAWTLLFVVADTGPGIPDDKVEYVFNRFSQVDDGLSRKHGGLGLGLAIVQRFAGLLGGCVCLDTEAERGSAFYLTVRVGRPRPRPAGGEGALAASVEEDAAVGGLDVLVVEDEAINQLTVRKFLEKMGHRPVMAENGQRALSLLASRDFDVVLMDIQMPVMDGEETTRCIRAMEHGQASIPIIAVTAHAMKGDVERFLACGMNACLAKPVEYEALRRAIAAVCPGRPGRGSLSTPRT